MSLDGELLFITPEDVDGLSDAEFRELFCDTAIQLEGECSDAFTREVPAFAEKFWPYDLTTAQMREIALEYQHWFNPKVTRLAATG